MPNNNIVPFSPNHASAVARLHLQAIKTGFLSKLGMPFLKTLYGSIGASPHSKVFVALDDASQNPIGFVAASVGTRAMYKNILVRRWLHFFVFLLPWVFRLSFLKRIAETLLYPLQGRENAAGPKIEAELLSIAVDEKHRGKGIGRGLVLAMENYYQNAGIAVYKVVTFSRDESANRFYQSLGFTLQRTFIHHGNIMNEYVKQTGGVSK